MNFSAPKGRSVETNLGEAEGDQVVRRVSLGADGDEGLCNPLVHHLQQQMEVNPLHSDS